MSDTFHLDDVMAGLAVIWRALPALAGVPVYDMPVTASADPQLVLIGDDGDPQSDAVATYEQQWTDIACTARMETGEIPCAVIAQSGDTDIEGRRAEASALMSAIGVSLVADQTLGGLVMGSQLIRGSAKGIQNSAGSAVVAPFTIRYLATV
jgi:hypothetical protein